MNPVPDLYAHLALPRDASPAEIHRAYRRRAKSDHPDAPSGSAAKFSMTKLAHDILSDPSRRAKYDATGDCSEATPDNRAAQRLETIAALLAHTLDNCAKQQVDPFTINLARELESLAENSIRDFSKTRAQLAARLPLANKLLGRFKRRTKKPKPAEPPQHNHLESIVAAQISGLNAAIVQIDAKIALFRETIEILKDYDFTTDTPVRAARDPRVFVQMFALDAGSGTGSHSW